MALIFEKEFAVTDTNENSEMVEWGRIAKMRHDAEWGFVGEEQCFLNAVQLRDIACELDRLNDEGTE